MAERITIVIEPSDEHGGFLTVQDAMHQVLDFIEVVVAAASDDARSKFEWRLVSASTNSPFTAVAEAVSADPEWPDIDRDARQAKARVGKALKSVFDTGELPAWVGSGKRSRVRHLLERNMNGIARTDLHLQDNEPPIVIVERKARAAINLIERAQAAESAKAADWSGEELGSVEGSVVETMTHHGQPAFRLLHRVSGERVTCVIPLERADKIGTEHVWKEVWAGQRCIVVGTIHRKPDGAISLVVVDEVRPVKTKRVDIESVARSDYTNGQSVREYLDNLWDE